MRLGNSGPVFTPHTTKSGTGDISRLPEGYGTGKPPTCPSSPLSFGPGSSRCFFTLPFSTSFPFPFSFPSETLRDTLAPRRSQMFPVVYLGSSPRRGVRNHGPCLSPRLTSSP